jgi:hypothetical protein
VSDPADREQVVERREQPGEFGSAEGERLSTVPHDAESAALLGEFHR